MTPPRSLEMLGTKHPVMQQNIPQTSKLNMLRLSQSTRWKSELLPGKFLLFKVRALSFEPHGYGTK